MAYRGSSCGSIISIQTLKSVKSVSNAMTIRKDVTVLFVSEPINAEYLSLQTSLVFIVYFPI